MTKYWKQASTNEFNISCLKRNVKSQAKSYHDSMDNNILGRKISLLSFKPSLQQKKKKKKDCFYNKGQRFRSHQDQRNNLMKMERTVVLKSTCFNLPHLHSHAQCFKYIAKWLAWQKIKPKPGEPCTGHQSQDVLLERSLISPLGMGTSLACMRGRTHNLL